MDSTRQGDPYGPKWRIGFYPGPPQIRMEEEEESPEPERPIRGRISTSQERESSTAAEEPDAEQPLNQLLAALFQERVVILQSTLPNDEKIKLLEQNRLAIATVRGGRSYKFATEYVIYAILFFSAFMITVLSLLTAFGHLPQEVTITFVGTVVGGTIATIAQKLGKVGSR